MTAKLTTIKKRELLYDAVPLYNFYPLICSKSRKN